MKNLDDKQQAFSRSTTTTDNILERGNSIFPPSPSRLRPHLEYAYPNNYDLSQKNNTIPSRLSFYQKKEAEALSIDTGQRAILIGASTGGVEALDHILSRLPLLHPPTLVVQHMPAKFVAGLARRFDSKMRSKVSVALHEEKIEHDQVKIASPDIGHLCLNPQRCLSLTSKDGPLVSGHRPSVDYLFLSALPHAQNVLAVLLTGMGRDGAEGMYQLKLAGACTIAQDKETSVVHGMPGAAIRMGGAMQVLGLAEIPDAIERWCNDYNVSAHQQ